MYTENQKNILHKIKAIRMPGNEMEAWREYNTAKVELYRQFPLSEHKFIINELLKHLRL